MTPYEADIEDQPRALAGLLQGFDVPAEVERLRGADVVLAGMGASHNAAYPTWRRLVAAGRNAWWVNASELLDNVELVTPDRVLWLTSQSGRSGEIVELIHRLADRRPRSVIATTNDPDSPLAEFADILTPLESGAEATVGTKTYLNTLAVHALVAAALTDGDGTAIRDSLKETLPELREQPGHHPIVLDIAERLAGATRPRVALVGTGDHVATALNGALTLKEAAKVPAEGYSGGAFRHGPIELAGPGMVVLLFTGAGSDLASLAQLAADLEPSGTMTVTIGPRGLPCAEHLRTRGPDASPAQLTTGIRTVQHVSVAVARATGTEPGAFLHGQKVTATL